MFPLLGVEKQVVICKSWNGTLYDVLEGKGYLLQYSGLENSVHGVTKSRTRLSDFHGLPVAQLVKNPPAMWDIWARSLGWEDPLEKGKVTHSSILAWKIPWTV